MKFKFKKYWRKTSLKKDYDGIFLLKHIHSLKPKNFLEIGVFHGVTSSLTFPEHPQYSTTGNDIRFTNRGNCRHKEKTVSQ